MPYSLRNLLFVIISGFLLVIATSLTLNQVTLSAHSTHDDVLAVAYQLRMAVQKIVVEVSPSGGNNELILRQSMEDVDQELQILMDYGQPQNRPIGDLIIYPTILHENYRSELDSISNTWLSFTTSWDELSKLSPDDPDYAIAKLKVLDVLTNLFTQVDSFNNTLNTLDDAQDANQAREQVFILVPGLLLLVFGWYVIIFRIIRPLGYLDAAMREIGHGENAALTRISANDEMGRLARSFETMRTEISAAQKLLENRVEERTAILTDAFEFSQEIVSQPDFNKLVSSITQRTKNILHANSVNLCLIAQDGDRLELVSINGEAPGAQDDRFQLPDEIMKDVQDASLEVDKICRRHQLLMGGGCLSASLKIGNRNIGALCVQRGIEHPFTDLENHTLKLLVNSAAVAIANVRLMEDSRRQVEMNATLTERQRLTSELHDEAAQTLGLLNLKVSQFDSLLSDSEKEKTAAELDQFRRLTERAQAQMRMAFSGMNNASVNARKDDLRAELKELANDFGVKNGISVNLIMDDLSSVVIPELVQKQAMYIYREALTNVRRYANAKTVQVLLEKIKDGIQLVVSDDGRGFDPEQSKSEHHLGLAVMQARMERVGGTLFVETAPGNGTKVTAQIPLAVNSHTISKEEKTT